MKMAANNTKLIARLRKKISPMEDVLYTEKILPLMQAADFSQYERPYKGQICVVVTPKQVLDTIYKGCELEHNLHDLTNISRSLQALLWERSYLKGNLVYTKTLAEIESDGF
jgi:hypothetical protein